MMGGREDMQEDGRMPRMGLWADRRMGGREDGKIGDPIKMSVFGLLWQMKRVSLFFSMYHSDRNLFYQVFKLSFKHSFYIECNLFNEGGNNEDTSMIVGIP